MLFFFVGCGVTAVHPRDINNGKCSKSLKKNQCYIFRGNTKTPASFLPSSSDAICLGAALEDFIDEIIILGHIMPANSTYSSAKSSMVISFLQLIVCLGSKQFLSILLYLFC